MTMELRGTVGADFDRLERFAAYLVPARQMAEIFAGTEFVPKPLRGRPDAVTAAIMYGAEIGVDAMQALQGIHVVEGRPQPSAELMRALIYRAGHTLTVHDSSGQRCRMSGLRAGRPESERATVEWTMDMARSAGLLHKDNWRKYPRAMLLARATGDLARMLFPDVVKGLGYVAEDAEVPPDLEPGEPVPEPQPRKAIQRRQRVKGRPVEDPPAPALEGRHAARDDAERPPIAPRPPAPTRVDPEDQPLPDMPQHPAGLHPPEPEPGPVEPDPGTVPDGTGDPAKRPGMGDFGEAPRRLLLAKTAELLGRNPDRTQERASRLALYSSILGRPLETSQGLSRIDGYRLLDTVQAILRGDLVQVVDPDTGVVTITEPPPPPDPGPPDAWAQQQRAEQDRRYP